MKLLHSVAAEVSILVLVVAFHVYRVSCISASHESVFLELSQSWVILHSMTDVSVLYAHDHEYAMAASQGLAGFNVL